MGSRKGRRDLACWEKGNFAGTEKDASKEAEEGSVIVYVSSLATAAFVAVCFLGLIEILI